MHTIAKQSPSLADLASAKRWVTWHTELRSGRATKVPVRPQGGLPARSTVPADWATRAEAERRAALLPPPSHGPQGVGIVLGVWPSHDDLRLGGLDLDSCRDAGTGALADWAAEVVEFLDTYAEVSPSGTGAKLFFQMEPDAVATLRGAGLLPPEGLGRSFKRQGEGEHPPAIEVHLGGRFYTVTGDRLPAAPENLRVVPTKTLATILRDVGPRFTGNRTMSRAPVSATAGDGSRSAIAFRIARQVKAQGGSYEDFLAACRADPAASAWLDEKGLVHREREPRRAWERAGDAPPTIPEKRLLFRAPPPPPPFPVEALGPLAAAAEAIHARTQAPLAICGQAVLAAATLAAQPHRDVDLPGAGRRPLTGFFVSIAESGERKTAVDRIALAAVYRLEAARREAHAEELRRHQAELEGWKEAAATIRKKGKGDRSLIRDGLLGLGPEPRPPEPPMLLVADATPEGLILHLAEARPWAGIFTAEGGMLIGGHAFNDESRMRTAALFNTLWDGEPIRRRRVLTGASFLPGRRVSAHLMMQATVAERLLADEMLSGIGLHARLLMVAPETTAGTRMFREPPASAWGALEEYNARIEALLRRPPATKPNDPGVLDPPSMRLAPDARALWITFHDHVEARLSPGGDLASIRAWGAKAAEHAGRLAAVLAVYADPDAMEVTGEAMACGIALVQHYEAEMQRLAGTAAVNAELRQADAVLRWIGERGLTRIHLSQVYQYGPAGVRDATAARAAVNILVEHGHLRPLPAGTEVDGASRREAWGVVP